MHKQLGATMLVAGTCIGGGMIALPMVMAKIGILPSLFVMLLFWVIIYYTAIINLELHLRAGQTLTLAQLCKKFSGPAAESIGIFCFKLLSYSLVVVYIYGCSSLVISIFDLNYPFPFVAGICSIIFFILMVLPIKLIDYSNRILFILLIGTILFLIFGLLSSIQFNTLPLFGVNYNKITSWEMVIPMIFAAFGFHGSIPAIVKYCQNDKKLLKKVFLIGSLIPAIVYVIWTICVIGVIHTDKNFYQMVIQDKIEVGSLVKQLSHIAKWQSIQLLIWCISFLAIITSLIGVGIALIDSNKSIASNYVINPIYKKLIAAIITILPAYLMAIIIPNAFISVLGFAGMILVIISIIIPIYLLTKIDKKKTICAELKKDHVTSLILITGIVIIICEFLNIL